MARLFDQASSEYLSTANAVVTTPPFTMACFYNTNTVAEHSSLIGIGDSASSIENYYYLKHQKNQGVTAEAYQNDGTIGSAYSVVSVSADTWTHAAAVFYAIDDRAAFTNGGTKGTNATSVSPTGLDVTDVGGLHYGAIVVNYMRGAIAEAAIWSAALTDAEVAILATGISPRAVRPASLVFYAPLWRDEDEDFVGGLTLTAYNTPSISAHPRVFYLALPQVGKTTAGGTAYDITIAQGSFTLTGQATGLLATRLLALAQGSFTLTGQATGLVAKRLLALDQGSYALTGQTTDLFFGHLIAAAQGSYALTGQATSLLAKRLLALDQGSFTLTGQSTGLYYGRLLALDQGSFALTGQVTGLLYGRLLTAEQGSFTLTGQATGLLATRLLALAQGSFTLTGQATDFNYGYSLILASGSFALTGQTTGFLVTRVLALGQGSFILTGQIVGLTQSTIATTPTERIFVILAENRIWAITLDGRIFSIDDEDRIYSVIH